MAKRGFFAELQHQNQVAARNRQKATAAAQREQVAAAKRAEAAQRQAERARAQQSKAAVADQKRADQEAKRLHVEAMQAEAEAMNADLAANYEAIDSLLAATLEVDDFVDLEQLRVVAVHPAFQRTDLEVPLPPPPPIVVPPEPQYIEPPAPKGLGAALGGKKRHAEAVAAAQSAHAEQHQAWQAAASQVPAQQLAQMQAHQQADQQRQAQLAEARRLYEAECQARDQEVAESNRELDQLIADLELHVESAVQEYVSIVLSNSVYPDSFEVSHEFEFDSGLRELSLTVTIPGPSSVGDTKEYKYNKAADEITATTLTQKQQKDRYAGAVHAVALRTMHEVFEADRGGHIDTIALSVGTEDIDPATGQMVRTPLIAVAADRASFTSFDLSNVVPLATLQHLNAVVSKNPHGLVAIDESRGVRGG
jgi:restriction system protein